MKRVHRRAHRIAWAILAPLIALSLWLAITLRRADPLNEQLPRVSLEEAH